MLISYSVPFLDLREFFLSRKGKLSRPFWADPDLECEFVRRVGPIRRRLLGPGDSALGEAFHCESKKLIGLDLTNLSKVYSRISVLRSYQRIFSHTIIDFSRNLQREVVPEPRPASGRFEFGFVCNEVQVGRRYLLSDVQSILNLATSMRRMDGGKKVPLFQVSAKLGEFYQSNTSIFSKSVESVDTDGRAGVAKYLFCSPAAIVVTTVGADDRYFSKTQKVGEIVLDNGVVGIYFRELAFHGKQICSFGVNCSNKKIWRVGRLVRLYITRYYSELQSMRVLVRRLSDNKIFCDEDLSVEALENFVMKCLKLLRSQEKSDVLRPNIEIRPVIRNAVLRIGNRDLERAEKNAEEIFFRKNPLVELKKFVSEEKDLLRVISNDRSVLNLVVKDSNVEVKVGETRNNIRIEKNSGSVQVAGASAKQSNSSSYDSRSINDEGTILGLAEKMAGIINSYSTDLGESDRRKLDAQAVTLVEEARSEEPDTGVIGSTIDNITRIAQKSAILLPYVEQISSGLRKLIGS